jgi:hypothetical protein
MLPIEATKKQTPMTVSLWCSARPSSIVRGKPAAQTTTITIRAGWRGEGTGREGRMRKRRMREKERRIEKRRK